MTTYVLTITSLSGRPLNITKQSTDSIAVYSRADLDRRLTLIAQDPDLRAEWREETS